MNFKKVQECERTRIEKWSQFQLHNRWKSYGAILCLILFATAMVLKFSDLELGWFKDVVRRGILVCLLVVSLSKEKDEDEMVVSLRAKSYTLAFIFGVGYAIVQPLFEIVVHNIVFEPNPENTFSYFEILFYMLFIQIMFFEVLKRNR
ncbi:hypothetical protein [Winogradskyella ursingii]|uniref:hypothetical protein n=1 Tax=Winogradskyella ursingii TaxID=2686079 RepID=UPI0015C7180B|nr:hypothetical protein [Winogradskyella ursingii]